MWQVANLHDAAKAADVEAVGRLVEEGADVNEKDARGITALGVAVGFNKVLESLKICPKKSQYPVYTSCPGRRRRQVIQP